MANGFLIEHADGRRYELANDKAGIALYREERSLRQPTPGGHREAPRARPGIDHPHRWGGGTLFRHQLDQSRGRVDRSLGSTHPRVQQP